MKDSLTDKKFWEKFWNEDKVKEYHKHTADFIPDWHWLCKDDLVKYMEKKCLEIGCFPGRYMNYFLKCYNMEVEGIDLFPGEQMSGKHQGHNMERFTVYVGDFLKMNVEQKYNVVCSFGFIEHFHNIEEIIEKHIKAALPGGIIIITVPNLVYNIWFRLKYIRDKTVFQSHNKCAMDPQQLRMILNTLECKNFIISPILLSQKIFSALHGWKEWFALAFSGLVKHFPYLDRWLATEILIKIYT